MGKKVKWSWTSAIIGAASALATTALLSSKPKDPTFHLISINLTSFKLNLPVLDTDLILNVHVTNPNITAVHYSSTSMSIFYNGSLLGSAELAHHAATFVADVAKREMVLDAAVDIAGAARILWWDHKFKVHVDSRVTVDPVFLDVIDQENKLEMEIFLT
ncbi:hypothetical protein L3X38_031940 [Prunus dulcis]|uniref:Late embryogenesis abundant protein LEA-2 subgroup domain-containing protein n=1 Tax=Prunus dulcis TaxID=3755 RepID=A0AAD4YW44_PRUDU|nr:hypothetical protein L3X38_031940 [Prunus dulcis]